MKSNTKDGKTIGALTTSFHIVEYLRTAGSSRLTDISSTLDIPKSTLHNHLRTLENHGFVTKCGPKYELGLRFIGFGESAKTKKEEYTIVEHGVEKIASETGERALFIVEEHGSCYYLQIKLGEYGVNIGPSPGDIGNRFHATSAGKVILAFTTPDKRESIIDSIEFSSETNKTVTSREELVDEIEEIYERGYAVNEGELLHGLHGLSVPVKYPDGDLLGALTVSGPKHRMKSERLHSDLPDLLLGVANEIELNIGRPLQS